MADFSLSWGSVRLGTSRDLALFNPSGKLRSQRFQNRQMPNKIPSDYYVARRRKLTRQLNRVVRRVRPNLTARYGARNGERIHRQILVEFDHLLPQIPYIGGRRNSMTVFLIQSAWALAFYRALQQHGGSVEDAGALL